MLRYLEDKFWRTLYLHEEGWYDLEDVEVCMSFATRRYIRAMRAELARVTKLKESEDV